MKIVAIWARVSTQDQRELSLDGQVERCRAKLEGLGHVVPPERILKVDWASMDLLSCPSFQLLRQWVVEKEVGAIGVLDRDRLTAKAVQRLLFLEECRENGVDLVICQGPPLLEDSDGEWMEFNLAKSKEGQVRRAQQGARDGLRDRALIKGLPPAPLNPYGFAWSKDRKRLSPTADWPNAQFICQATLGGLTLGGIRQELHRQGIPTPTGKEWWAKQVIGGILANPIYGGRFYALRREAVLPAKRLGNSYGKTGSRRKPLSEATYLPDIVVESPPLTWEQWLSLKKRLERNKLLAQRNAKRDYLLRGLILCETHHRRYHGRPKGDTWCYICPICYEPGKSRCATPYLNGHELEANIKEICQNILSQPEIIEAEIAKQSGQVQETLKAIVRKLKALEVKEAKTLDTEANLVWEKATGGASLEAYDRAFARNRAEKAWITEERERLAVELALARRRKGLVLGLAEVRERLLSCLERGTNADWREVFTALGLEVRVGEDGKVEVALSLPVTDTIIVADTPRAASLFPLTSCWWQP